LPTIGSAGTFRWGFRFCRGMLSWSVEGRARSGMNIVCTLVYPPAPSPHMDRGDIWFNNAEVEVGKSFLGLNVLMGDEDDDDDEFDLAVVVEDRPGVLTGVSSSFGSKAAFFIIPISRLWRHNSKPISSNHFPWTLP
jgi:hypothetical protein